MKVDLRRKGKEKVESPVLTSQSVLLRKRQKTRKINLKRKRRNEKSRFSFFFVQKIGTNFRIHRY